MMISWSWRRRSSPRPKAAWCACADVQPSERARELARRCEKDPRVVELILQESSAVLRIRPGAIIVANRLGLVLANAGIDASNVEAPADEEAVLLLPANPDASAERIRAGLQTHQRRRFRP